MIEELENEGVIAGYKAIINPELRKSDTVSALIELKITPQRDRGFNAVAERIRNYPEIQSVYLMSGGFDLALMMEGRTMRDIAYFRRKACDDRWVTSTATHFVLQKYKDNGISFEAEKRGQERDWLVMIDYDQMLSSRAMELKPSGIRKFFDILEEMQDVVSLTVGGSPISTLRGISAKQASGALRRAEPTIPQTAERLS